MEPPEPKLLTTATDRNDSTDLSEVRYGRGARTGIILLLLLTVVFAAGALFAKFNLEAFRTQVEKGLEEHMGANLDLGAVTVNGLRGLRLDDLTLTVETEGGPRAKLRAPLAYVHINLTNLFYGAITVDQIVMNKAELLIERPLNAAWYSPDGFDLHDLLDLPPSHGFRVTGEDGRVEIRNIVGDTETEITDFRFDIARLVDATDLSASLQGHFDGDADKLVKLRLTMASFQDFDLRVESDRLTAEDVSVFLPAERHFVQTGVARPTLWVGGRPDDTLLVSLNASFDDVSIRDQPEFLKPADGELTVHATYDTDVHELVVTTAKAESQELIGAVEGSVSFREAYPEFDLRLRATRLPVVQMLDYVLEGQIEDYGETELVLNEPHELVVALTGTTQQPLITARVSAGSGEFNFAPEDKGSPRIRLAMGAMEGEWNSDDEKLSGRFTIQNGEATHPDSNLTFSNLSGVLNVSDKSISISPLNGTFTGQPVMAEVSYDIESGNGEATLSGMITQLEGTQAHDALRYTRISGSVDVPRARIVKKGDRYELEAQVDATQAQVDYAWWFSKPAGVGARGVVRMELANRRTLLFAAEGEVASSPMTATVSLHHTKRTDEPWQILWAKAASSRLDVTSLAQCLTVPYRVTGGTATEAEYSWERNVQYDDAWALTAGGHIDDLTIVPEADNAVPMTGKGVQVSANITKGPVSTGNVTLHVASAVMPSLDDPWLVQKDLTKTPWGETLPQVDRKWTYILAADALVLPPWQGTDFHGSAHADKSVWGFTNYEAQIEGGRIQGSYELARAENAYKSTIAWQEVPSRFILSHLDWPEVLTGPLTGSITYGADRDDPSTLRGEGAFTIREGKFSADYVASLIEGHDSELAVMPPSLDFHELTAQITLERDVIRTPEIRLVSDGIQMTGEGHYVREGDMDYRIKVAVSPDTAERIPVLKENLNIQGHRLAQQSVELGFRIEGPTFNPTGQLEELPPVGVTLVSGAIAVTSQVIDFPRRILVDLLKIGGGIVGAGT